MRIALAIYTATEGYSWQSGTTIAVDLLAKCKRIIGKFPDPSIDTIPFGGAFLIDDLAFFYRFHVAKKIDSKGRDALYLVLGCCNKKDAENLDFKFLYALNEFSAPQIPFPTYATYIAGKSQKSDVVFSSSFEKSLTGTDALSQIGYLLSSCPDSQMVVKISGTYSSPCVFLKYSKPFVSSPQQETLNAHPVVHGVPPTSPDDYGSNRSNCFNGYEKTIGQKEKYDIATILLLALVFTIGCIAGYFFRGFEISQQVMTDRKTTTITDDTKNIDPSNSDTKNVLPKKIDKHAISEKTNDNEPTCGRPPQSKGAPHKFREKSHGRIQIPVEHKGAGKSLEQYQ